MNTSPLEASENKLSLNVANHKSRRIIRMRRPNENPVSSSRNRVIHCIGRWLKAIVQLSDKQPHIQTLNKPNASAVSLDYSVTL